MATKQQQSRARKQEKRRLKSKHKAKVYRMEKQRINASFNLSHDKDEAKRMSVYDLIASKDVKLMRREMQRRGGGKTSDMSDADVESIRQYSEKRLSGKKHHETSDEMLEDVQLTGIDLLKGINDMITLTVKLHAGLVVWMRLAGEGRFEITPEQHGAIGDYEQKVIEFCEDVHAVTTLHAAGRQPTDYLEIVIHITDVMDDLVNVHRDVIYKMILDKQEEIEQYAVEHRPADCDNYTYMCMLHEQRVNEVQPLYATESNKEIVANLLSLDASLTEEPDLGDDLNLAPSSTDVGEDEALVAPQDPVTEAQAQ